MEIKDTLQELYMALSSATNPNNFALALLLALPLAPLLAESPW